MKKIIFALSTVLLSISFSLAHQFIKPFVQIKIAVKPGISIETIFENYIKAIGGKENIKKIKDISIKSTASIQGQQIEVLQLFKTPNLSKTSMSMAGMGDIMVQTFDGTKAIMLQMGQKQELNGGMLEAVKLQSELFHELKLKENAGKYKLEGTEKINDKDAYKISILMSDTSIHVWDFYEVQSGLKVRRKLMISGAPNGANEQVSDFSNFKELNGVKFPFTNSSAIMGQTFVLQVQSLDINKSISDEMFILK